MKWWEKTVEYSFVIEAVRNELFNLLIPLDGDVESIGDSVISKDSHFFIIEFKKSLNDLSGEYAKYEGGKKGFQNVAKLMQSDSSSRAHFLIGGQLKKGHKYISIEARRYFGVNDEPMSNIKELFADGLTRTELEEYTNKFTKYKTKSAQEDSDEASSHGFTSENVLAVSKSKKQASVVPLHFFKAPAPKLKIKNDNQHSTFSRGRRR